MKNKENSANIEEIVLNLGDRWDLMVESLDGMKDMSQICFPLAKYVRYCSKFGTPLCEKICHYSQFAQIMFYTDTTLIDSKR